MVFVFICLHTVNVLKFQTLIACQKDLDKQRWSRSAAWLGSSLFAILKILLIPALKTNILFENRKVLKILERLLWLTFIFKDKLHVEKILYIYSICLLM